MTGPDEESAGGFDALGLEPALIETVRSLGYRDPTPIQRDAIPLLLEGRDLLGLAATGTGKTAAFALPILQGLPDERETDGPWALIVVPTRELAMQVGKAVRRYGRRRRARVLSVYGGTPLFHQIRVLEQGVDVVVATPGRAVDLAERGFLDLGAVGLAVLDEADEMLDMGFAEELEAILVQLPDERQTALFSATFPRRLRQVASTLLTDPVRVAAEVEEVEGEAPRVRQQGYLVAAYHKRAALARILDMEVPGAALVFCRTRVEVEELTEGLAVRGFRAEALHGGRSQSERDRVVERLRGGTANLVVATDVAARGLDIEHLTHVINVHVPEVPEQYVHRIGRTGRAGREGVAITLVEPRERRRMRDIEQLTGQPVLLEPVPTLEDLAARRLELLVERVRELAGAEELEPLREAVADLDLEAVDVAAAALEALRRATWGGEDDVEDIPPYAQDRPPPRRTREREPRRRPPPPPEGWATVFIGMGKTQRLRPGDLFGALLNETSLERGDVGAIELESNHSLVQVPEAMVAEVVEALRATSLRGKKPVIRRDRYAYKRG